MTPLGLLVDIEVRCPDSWSSTGVDSRVVCAALVDTGATHTVVDAATCDRLQPPSGGRTLTLQGMQSDRVWRDDDPYVVDTRGVLLVFGALHRVVISAAYQTLPSLLLEADVRAVLGRDVLREFTVYWDGPSEDFVLRRPA